MAIVSFLSNQSYDEEETPLLYDDNKNTTTTTPTTDRALPFLPSSQKGFSKGFVSFVESKGGIIFGLLNLCLYYILAIQVFSYSLEHWSIIDSIYFATVIFTTIGYGDVTPSTDAGRLFTVFFSLYGIFILGFFAGIIGEKLVEMHTNAMENMRAEKRLEVTNMFGTEGTTAAASSTIIDVGSCDTTNTIQGSKQEQRTPWPVVMEVLKLELPLIAFIFLVGIVYGTTVEKWTLSQSIYFTTITSSTVGFGDFSPSHPWARLASVLIFPLAVAVFCEVLGRIAGSYLKYKMARQEEEFLNQQLTKSDLDLMDTNHDGHVSWGEFLVFMLTAMQKVDEDDIAQLKQVFEKLDRDGTGVLSKGDLIDIVQQQKQSPRRLN